MLGKTTTLVLGLGAGYVLGTKAGRTRYEQIKTQADRLWHDPKVQEKMPGAAHKAGHRTNRANGSEPYPSGSQPGAHSPVAKHAGEFDG